MKKLRQLFCKHNYEIIIKSGIGFGTFLTSIDTAELTCYCTKCNKRIITVNITGNGKVIKV